MNVAWWEYDDMVYIGKDFAIRQVVEACDARHRRLRDIKRGMSDIGHRGVNKDRFRAEGDRPVRANYPDLLAPIGGTVLAFKIPVSIL